LTPCREEVLRALPTNWSGVRVKHIVYESVGYRVDEPRFYPLIGPARLVHAQWKCTVIGRDKVEVVPIEIDYLIPSRETR
jgi:hypothetical protein